MGKKASQSSLKVPKNDHKKQLHSLIKVLKPKVYITDSSSFKSLVQELTGNGAPIPITTISSPSPPPQVIDKDHIPLIDQIDDLGVGFGYQETNSVELSVDSSELSVPTPFTAPGISPEPCLAPESSSFMTQEMDFSVHEYYRDIESSPQGAYIPAPFTACESSFMTHEIVDLSQCYRNIESSPSESCIPAPFTACESSFNTHDMNFSQYRDVESWLLEIEPLPYCNYNSYAPPLIQQEVCVYDYDFSGLM